MGNEVALWDRTADVFIAISGALGSLLRWECQGGLEEFEERGLPGATSTEDENTGRKRGLIDCDQVGRGRVGCHDLLEWCGVLSSPDPSGTVHGTDRTTGIAVPSTMCHALGASVGVDLGDRRHSGDAGHGASRLH